MERQKSNFYAGPTVPNHQQRAQETTIMLQSIMHQQQQNLTPTKKSTTTSQAEYFDISRNQPSTVDMAPPKNANNTYRSDVKDLAYKLDMRRGSVERWLREKYNREHPNDKIMHPRGFKFSEEQRRQLMDFFERDRYPKPHEMELLAYELNVKKEQVKNWFHDQRRKFKRLEQLAKNNETNKKNRKSRYTRLQRKKLEEFFEKNFHPYPGDSRQIVNQFESSESPNIYLRYQGTPMRYDSGNLPNSKGSVQSRGFKFTEDQRFQLKEEFSKTKYPTTHDMERIARNLGVRKVQIKNWFHDQRAKVKRQGNS